MALPYSNSKANPATAQKRIRSTLLKFGVKRIIFDEDFENSILIVRFQYEDYPVSLPVDYGALAELYMEDAPWSSYSKRSEDAWVEWKRDIAYRASFSLLDDFIKGMVMVIELGIFSFEEIFMAHFVNKKGQRLSETVLPQLPGFLSGQLALKE